MSVSAETRSIVVERTMPHPPETVWRALTEAGLVSQWLMTTDLKPVVGHRFNFRATPIPNMWNGVTDCEVLAVEAPSRLVYSWNASGDEAADGLKSTVTWTLTPADGGTHVRMEHAGFRPQDEGGRQAMGGGWPRIVQGLERVAGELT